MFVELMSVLVSCTVLITVAKVDDKVIRVNVIPHGKTDDNPALSTPLTFTGSPEELDAELGKHLAGYAQTYQQTASTLAEAKATRAARAVIRDAVGKGSKVSYWLDMGNNADSGQFILGEPLNNRNRRARLRLRTAAELYAEIVDPNLDDNSEPSCSSVEALERQEPFVNSALAQHALALLARLFRYGEISYDGGFINLASGMTSSLRVDPENWKRTRRVTKHTFPIRHQQENGPNGRANEGRVAGPNRRA